MKLNVMYCLMKPLFFVQNKTNNFICLCANYLSTNCPLGTTSYLEASEPN